MCVCSEWCSSPLGRSDQEVEHHSDDLVMRDLDGIKDWTNLSGMKQSDPALHPHEDKGKNRMEWN